jgi:hypothetical protein
MQIGHSGPSKGSNDTSQLGRPADMVVDPESNELFVADGYGNHRVIVFDADTGAYKRHWGAYGKPPTDDKITYDPKAPPPLQFNNPVHCIRLTRDGFVLVCDRGNNRIQMATSTPPRCRASGCRSSAMSAAVKPRVQAWTLLRVPGGPGTFSGRVRAAYDARGREAGEIVPDLSAAGSPCPA